jgi:surfeit locus 1 family protein
VSGRRFRPRALLAIVTVAFCALAISAGVWQTRRAEEKAAIQARLERLAVDAPVPLPTDSINAREYALRRVIARGEFDARHTILLDNRVLRGRAGYHVLAPLRLAGSDRYVLVNRGWIAAGRTRDDVPDVPTPAGAQRIEGVATEPGAVFELADSPPAGRVWQNLVLDRYSKWSGLPIQAVVIQQTDAADDGLVREWARPDAGVDRHRSYALQWYSFAVLAAGLYVYFSFRRPAKSA